MTMLRTIAANLKSDDIDFRVSEFRERILLRNIWLIDLPEFVDKYLHNIRRLFRSLLLSL